MTVKPGYSETILSQPAICRLLTLAPACVRTFLVVRFLAASEKGKLRCSVAVLARQVGLSYRLTQMAIRVLARRGLIGYMPGKNQWKQSEFRIAGATYVRQGDRDRSRHVSSSADEAHHHIDISIYRR